MNTKLKTVRILGTRGVPARHGGFETFAEHLALFLVGRGWRVIVYCQEDGKGVTQTDDWRGVERVRIPVSAAGAFGTIQFDWRATKHASAHDDLCLTLGYNTAAFSTLLRLRRVPNVMNMDGIEWSRAKWSPPAKTWLWLNDWLGCWLANHLVADHPEIQKHLTSRVSSEKITMIPYGADPVTEASSAPLGPLGLEPRGYVTFIARPEPENSLLEIVAGFSQRDRGLDLAVLGQLSDAHPYHRAVKQAAGPRVKFLGAIYDKPIVQALRFHSAAHIHGHQVGGTNPSLVEALGAGNAIIAHDNRFNRWVAGDSARYFLTTDDFSSILDQLAADPGLVNAMSAGSRTRFTETFTWPAVLAQYQEMLEQHLP